MKHKISILIPAYQSENYLERCIRSVITQSYTNIEVLIYDDGSTDHTYEIASSYAAQYPNICVLKGIHVGLSSARNRLLKEYTGDYIFFLDADDFLEKDALKILYDTSQQYHADIVQCEMEKTFDHQIHDKTNYGIIIYNKEQALKSYNRSFEGPRCMSAGKLYKKEVFKDIFYPDDERTQEDEYVAFLLLAQCNCFVSVRQKLYGYFHNPNSITRKPFSMEQFDILPAIQDSMEFYKSLHMPEQLLRIQFRYLTIIQKLYTQTLIHFPEETKKLAYLWDEYHSLLPEVMTHLELPAHIKEYFFTWPDAPLSKAYHEYWYYVQENIFSK